MRPSEQVCYEALEVCACRRLRTGCARVCGCARKIERENELERDVGSCIRVVRVCVRAQERERERERKKECLKGLGTKPEGLSSMSTMPSGLALQSLKGSCYGACLALLVARVLLCSLMPLLDAQILHDVPRVAAEHAPDTCVSIREKRGSMR